MTRKTAWLSIAVIALMLAFLLLPTSHAQRSKSVNAQTSSRKASASSARKATAKRRVANFPLNRQAPAGEGAPELVAAGATILAESCSTANGAIDPGETVTVSFCVRNTGGTNTLDDLTGTLQATGGVTSPSGPQLYGTVVAGGQAVCRNFTFTAAAQSCGSALTASILFASGQTNLGTITYNFTLGAPSVTYSENFDGVTAPALPAGWTTTASGTGVNWVNSTGNPDTAPNAAFTPNQSDTGEASLISPVIAINSATAQLTFRHNYNLESGFDGGVLEIKIGAGTFTDILAAGGSFASGGYNDTLDTGAESCPETPNPLAGRDAWTGASEVYQTTIVNLPAAAAGQNIQLRWRAGFDCSESFSGWRVDTVSIGEGFVCCAAAAPAINLVKLTNGTDNNEAPGPTVPVGSTVTFTYVVTNTGNVPLASISVRDDNGTAGNLGDDFNATFVGGDTNLNGLLDLTETWTFTASRIATPGQYTNTGTATGSVVFIGDGDTQTVSDTDVDNHFGANPNITISINDVSQAEGNTGTMPFTSFNFTVSLSAASSQTVTVRFKTQNGTANIGYAAEDFLPDTGTVTFNPGDLAKTVTILVNGDTQVSPDETFFVNLSNPTNATIADGQGQGTILNDDANGREPLPPTAFAITNSNQLLSFNIAFPGQILSRAHITGLAFGEAVICIDFRPANGQLYGFTNYNRLVTINLTSAVATIIANVPGLIGDEYDMDFNPTNDRLRIVNNRDQNYSVNPDDGAATVQTNLNPGDPNISGIAYTNNFAGAATTTLYAVDSVTDTLYTQNPPASGMLTPVGPLGVSTSQIVGFDIAPTSSVAYVTLSAALDNAASLYAVNLATGKAHLVGAVGSEPTAILDISVSTIPPPDIVGLTPSNKLILFNALTPSAIIGPIPINALRFGEVVIALDVSPDNSEIYGYTNYNRLVLIANIPTGSADVIGSPANLAGNEYGFDFNPTVDRIRVVNDTDQNIRVNPNDGSLTATDGMLAYAAGDPNFGQNPGITGAAYTNNFAGATATTLYDIDFNLGILARQNPPNNGTLNTVGPLGVNISAVVGFDIAAANGAAYASFQPPLGGISNLFTIDLLTGRATSLGVIGGFEAVRDIAVVRAGSFRISGDGTAAVAETAGSVTLTVLRFGDAAIAASVSYATSDGTATAGSDYTAVSGTLFFNVGETSKTITIPILDNAGAEANENFMVPLSNPTGGNFTGFPRIGVVNIVNVH